MNRPIRILLVVGVLAAVLAIPPVLAQDGAATVEVFNIGYEPEEVTVNVGDTVTFDWLGGFHTVSSDDCGDGNPQDEVQDDCYRNGAGEVFDSGPQGGEDATFTFTFDEPGTFEFFCDIHSSPDGAAQNGVVTVQGDGPTEEPTDQPTDQPTDEPTDEPTEEPAPQDPVANSLAWSADLADGSTTEALLGTTQSFADSLASGSVQGDDTPLLLTGRDELDPRVVEELTRLGVQQVTILGGTAAISQAVEDDLVGRGFEVQRRFGPTRVETSVEIARSELPDADTAIIARSTGEGTAAFADSLGAGAVGAANGWPVLLTPTDSLHPAVEQYLTGSQVEEVLVVGGIAAISDDVVTALEGLGLTVNRSAGASRFGTAAALANLTTQPAVFAGADQPQRVVIEGTGELAWTSGFPAAVHAPGGIILAATDTVPATTLNAALFYTTIECGPLVSSDNCDLVQGASSVDAATTLTAEMSADQEVPPNDSGATGTALFYRTGVDGVVCYEANSLMNLTGPVMAAHIHEGAAGVAGDVLIDLPMAPVEGFEGLLVGCNSGVAQADLDAVYAAPADYYVNLHTEQNPGGELRGQLTASS